MRFPQEGFSHCASEACSFLLSLPGLDSVVGRRLVEYLAKSVSRALESQVPVAAASAVTQNQKPAATLMATTSTSPAANGTSSINSDDCDYLDDEDHVDDDHDDSPSNSAGAVARGLTPPSSSVTPPAAPPVLLRPSCPQQITAATATVPGFPPRKPVVALTASNHGPPSHHTVVRPKPTRPAFGRPSSSSPQDMAAAAAAAAVAAAQRDPMWRPW